MGNAKKVLFAVAFILLIVILGPCIPNENIFVKGDAPPNSPYEGSGNTIDVYDYARNNSQTFTDGVNDTSFTYEDVWYPSGYRGYRLQSTITDLTQTVDPVPNGDFDQYSQAFYIDGTQIGEEVQNWTLSRNDGQNDDRRIISQIENSTGGNPGDCMDIRLRYGRTGLTVAEANIDNDFNYFSPTTPESLTLEFDIKFSADITQVSWLNVKVAVLHQTAEVGIWESTTDSYHPTSWSHQSFNTIPVNGTVTLRIAIQKLFGSRWSSVNGHIYFDNFRYVIKTASQPSLVNLELNGSPISNAGGQNGSIDIYANAALREETPLANCWSTSQNFDFSSPFNVSFHYQYSMFVKSENTDAAISSFSAPVDQDPTWEINYTIPGARPPSGHTGYFFGLYLTSEWTLSQVKNNTGHDISTYQYNVSTRFVSLDENIAVSGDTFSIIASSLNYVLQIHPQKGVTATGPWSNISLNEYFVAGDWLRVMAILRPIGGSGNSANVTIFYPNRTVWNYDESVSFFSNNDTLVSSSWQIPSIEEEDAGSHWLITVAFDNSTQCGLRQQSFTVAIPTFGLKIEPAPNARVIWGQTVLVNVTWQNNDNSEYITDASAQIRYIDRNLQVQYQAMTANGLGAYSSDFITDLMSPDRNAEFYVELYRFGYINASYDAGTQLTFTINLVNDIDYQMVKPTQLTGPDEYLAETTLSEGYTSQVRFYDPYQNAYIRNDSGIWKDDVRVNYTYYEDPIGPLGWAPIRPGSFIPDAGDPTLFFNYDPYSDVEQVKYVVTMRVVGGSWDYEQQNFTIIIRIVQYATNLDALRTKINYPPTGMGDGWTQYDNSTDIYIVHVYWNEYFNITVYYENESTSTGITGATVQILIGTSLNSLDSIGGGYYNYTINTVFMTMGPTDFYINASQTAHATQTIKIRLVVEARATELTKDNPRSTAEIPYDDDFIVTFTYTDIVPTSPIGVTDASISIIGYASNKYTIVNHTDGTYTITFWGNITEDTYYVMIYFTRTNYTSQSQYYEITVSLIQTYTSGSALSGSVPWGDNVTINIQLNDTDHSYQGIPSATISFEWYDNLLGTDYWFIDNGDGTYTIILNTTKVPTGTQGYMLNFNITKIHYKSALVSVSFQVRDRLTALYIISVMPGSSVPWGDNLTIYLTYNDTDLSSNGIPDAIITCDWDQYYWNYYYNSSTGSYVLTIQTISRLEGSYTLHIYASKIHYHTFMTIQGFITRNIQTNYQVDPVFTPSHPWGSNLTIRVDYIDLDHGCYIPYAAIDANWDENYYSIYWLGNGTYLIELNTTSRDIGSFTVQITITRLHYQSQIIDVDFTLVGRNTLVTYTAPQPIPFTDNITFTIFYNDTVTLTSIPNVTGNVFIVLSCTEYPALILNYTIIPLNNGNDGYFITIDTGNFPAVNEWYTFLVNISWLNVPPYYQNQTMPVSGYIRSVHTSLELEFTSMLYWGDTLFVNATYRDVDHDVILSGGGVMEWLSWPSWSVNQIYPDGTYLIEVDTTAANIGLANFTIRFSKLFYETSEQRVQFTINPIPLYVEILSTTPWIAEYQTLVNISVRVTDEFGNRINDSQTVYYWAGLSPENMTFIQNGMYNFTFLADQSVGTYIVNVEASNLPNYQTGIGIVMLNIIPIDSELEISGPSSPIVAGDTFQIFANFSTIYGAALPSANLYYNWAGGNATLTNVSGETFSATLDSTGLDAGLYTIYITASHPNVVEKLGIISVTLIVMPAYLEVDSPVINVEWGYDFVVLAHLFDNNLQPITGANIQYIWGNLNGSLQPTATPGWYNISLPSNIFSVGVYELTLSCDQQGYQFVMTSVGLNIQPRQTQLDITEIYTQLVEEDIIIPLNGTAWDVPRGDIIWIYLNFTDSTGNLIDNATGVYTWELGSGILQFVNGLYRAQVNLTDVSPALYTLLITLTRHNFETANTIPFQLNVIPVPTSIQGLPDTISLFTGEPFNIQVRFNDTYHNLGISEATLYVTITGLGITRVPMQNNGDGTFTLSGLSALTEGTYFITIEASTLPKYHQATASATVVVQLSPLFRTIIQAGALSGLIIIIILILWLAYARVWSVPWIVRKMRGMAKTIDRGKTPTISKRDQSRLPNRETQVTTILTPTYESAEVAVYPMAIPTEKLTEERRMEDEDVWLELEKLEGLGMEEKQELFKEMKKIPAKDRVWFMEDMKKQMAEGRFDYLRTGDVDAEIEVEEEAPAVRATLGPAEQAALVAVLREGLQQFNMISDDDKDALVQQLIIMTPEEREETIRKLMARMKGMELEEPKSPPKIEKRKKKVKRD